jgi:hypothetical protein
MTEQAKARANRAALASILAAAAGIQWLAVVFGPLAVTAGIIGWRDHDGRVSGLAAAGTVIGVVEILLVVATWRNLGWI